MFKRNIRVENMLYFMDGAFHKVHKSSIYCIQNEEEIVYVSRILHPDLVYVYLIKNLIQSQV